MKRTIASMIIAATAGATLLAPASAVAGGVRVERSAACSQFGRSDLKVSPQNGRLEVEHEVDTNRRGERYRVRLFHGARRVDQVVRRTGPRSGSFTVRNVETNRRGTDRFRAVAVRLGGGNRCAVVVRF